MKCFSKFLCVIALAPILGCNQGTTGGPGVSDSKVNKSVTGRSDDTFNLSVPLVQTSVQQGNKTEGIIGINRAKNFDGDVTLEFKNLPAGVTIQPERPMIKHGDSDTKISVIADDSAVKGEFKIDVTGHPNKGADAKIDFRIAITGQDSFTSPRA
jgi:hypothetical protein